MKAEKAEMQQKYDELQKKYDEMEKDYDAFKVESKENDEKLKKEQ